MIQSLFIPSVQHVYLLSGICVKLRWLESSAEVVLWPWQDFHTYTTNGTHTLGPFHRSSTLSSICPLLPSAAFLSFLPAWCSVKTAVKRSLISPATSQGNPNEKILPTFSSSCHTTHHKCWQQTAVPSLTFCWGSWRHTHTRTIPINWQCLWISRVSDGVEEFNDTQCRFNFSAPRPGYQVHHLSFIQRRKRGAWVAL